MPPQPSRTEIRTAPDAGSRAVWTVTDPPAGVWRMAFSRRLQITRTISGAADFDDWSLVFVRAVLQLDALGLGGRGWPGHGVIDEFIEGDRL